MKAGGADVHILPPPEAPSKIVAALQSWIRRFDDFENQPQAVAAIAFSLVDGEWVWSCIYHSHAPSLPVRLLPVMAAEYLRAAITGDAAEQNIMAELGYSK
jgi:hypothetical protein